MANAFFNSVSAYSINGTTGALMPVAGSPFPAGVFPDSVTVDPTGQFAYVVNGRSVSDPGNVSAYVIKRSGGLLPLCGSPFPTGSFPRSVTTTAGPPPPPPVP